MAYINNRTSHYAANFAFLRSLAEKSTQYRLVSDRLVNGRKFPELYSYRTQLAEVLTYQRTVVRARNDSTRINKVLAITNAYEIALRPSAAGSLAGNRVEGLQGYAEPLLQIVREGLQPGVDVEKWQNDYGQGDFDNRLRAIQTLLNTRVGERYIFAGRRYNEGPPVRNLTNLAEPPLPTTQVALYQAFTQRNLLVNNSSSVADHDKDASDTPATNTGEIVYTAHLTSVLQIEDRQTIEYGVSSNREPINQLLLAARLLKRALALAPSALADRQALLNDAEQYLDSSIDGFRQLRQRSARVVATLQVAQARQLDVEITTQTLVDRITSADITQAGVELSALAQQFSATLQTIETRNSLSLANIL